MPFPWARDYAAKVNPVVAVQRLVERAEREGPQTIPERGTPRAVVLSIDDYRALVNRAPSPFLAQLDDERPREP